MKKQKALQRGFILLLILGMLLSFVPALARAEGLTDSPAEATQTPALQPETTESPEATETPDMPFR